MQTITYFLLLTWKVNISDRQRSGLGYFGSVTREVHYETHLVFPPSSEGRREALSHCAELSALSQARVVLMSAVCTEAPHVFFRMAKLLRTKYVWWDIPIVNSNGKGKPCRAVTSTQTFSCKEGSWIAEMNDLTAIAVGFFWLLFVPVWLLQATCCLPSQDSSQNVACGNQFPFTLRRPGIYILCSLFVLTFLLPL